MAIKSVKYLTEVRAIVKVKKAISANIFDSSVVTASFKWFDNLALNSNMFKQQFVFVACILLTFAIRHRKKRSRGTIFQSNKCFLRPDFAPFPIPL